MTDIDDLITRLEYHGKHCLDRNGEQSAIMLAAIDALRAQRDEIARLTKDGPTDFYGTTDNDGKPVATTLREEAYYARAAARAEADFADEQKKRAERAEAERDAAMKDAERYRWLRACRAGDWDALNNLRLAQSMCGLDTAIDAAIAKGKG